MGEFKIGEETVTLAAKTEVDRRKCMARLDWAIYPPIEWLCVETL